ncbi:MAG TPA: hypothetical protein DCE07_05680 [Peptococcaceae bacterium]|nr:hypothetical protein [Peptococcaceae bacterium]
MKELPAAKKCFVCGDGNPSGLQVRFYHDGNEAKAVFIPDSRWEGYPGVVHGGILASLLDEVMYKAVFASEGNVVTARMSVRFRNPARVGSLLHLVGRVGEKKGRFVTAKGEIRDSENRPIATAEGVFCLLSPEQEEQFGAADLFGERSSTR